VLVLYWSSPSATDNRPAISHHISAIRHSPSRHRLTFWNAVDEAPAPVRHAGYDAVILHTTFLWLRWFRDFDRLREKFRWLSGLGCLKIAMPQDEYDHSETLDGWLESLGVDYILSVYGPEKWPVLYPRMSRRAAFRQVLTGYVDEQLAGRIEAQLLSFGDRDLDLVYRANHLPYWFGSFGQLKHLVGEEARAAAERLRLRSDVSTRAEDAITGDDWFDFLASGKVVVGSESGSSVLDRRGEVRAAIESLLRANPLASFQDVSRDMPAGWDSYEFPALSPRHLEAVMTRTCQVLVEGLYSGVLVAGRHYVPVRNDLGNLGEALQLAADPRHGRTMTERAYEEICRSGRYTYRALAGKMDEILETRPPQPLGVRSFVVGLAARPYDQRSRRWEPGGVPSRMRRRLVAVYKGAGSDANAIPRERLLAEGELLDRVSRAQNLEPGTPSYRVVRASSEGHTLVLTILASASTDATPVTEIHWPPDLIVVRGLYVEGLMWAPVGRRRKSGVRLDAVAQLAKVRPGAVEAVLKPLLGGIGGARSRPGLGGARARLKTVVATGRALARRPRDAWLLASALGHASIWEMADDLVKLDLLESQRGRLSAQVDPSSHTLRLRTSREKVAAGVPVPHDAEIEGIVWDNSAISDRASVPVLGRRMTVYLGAAGVHEFTAIAALPRSTRDSVLERLRA
jgi:hypothetical protein